MTIAVVARMLALCAAHVFGLPPQTLQYWYKNFLSDYLSDIDNKKWHPAKIESVNKDTGELMKKPVYILKRENLGEKMSVDDTAYYK